MGKYKNLEEWREGLVGKQFGRLTVQDVENYLNKDGKKKGYQAKCQCSCGKEKIVVVNSLLKGLTTSCGCLAKEVSAEKLHIWRRENPIPDKEVVGKRIEGIKKSKEVSSDLLLKKYRETLISKKYGNLTVVEVQPHTRKSTGDKDGFEAICECTCGNTVIVILNNLLSGNTTSCGCNKGRSVEQWKEELIGKCYGRLTIRDVQQHYEDDQKKGFEAICECTCGNIKIVPIDTLFSGKVVSCGCFRKEKSVENGKLYGSENIKKAQQWQKEHPEETKKFQQKAVQGMLTWHKDHPYESQLYRTEARKVAIFSTISKEEEEIYNYLLSLGYSVEHQFLLEGHYFDFRVNNFLIEYHGSTYHYSKYENLNNPESKEPPSKPREKTFHRDIYTLSKNNGFHLIQVWDYDWLYRKEFVQKLIKDQLYGTANYKDYLEGSLLNNDYGFIIDGEQVELKGAWVSTYYRTLVDENYSKGKVLVFNSGYTKIK